jgi:ATP-dependent Clp protease ATP-binding subunit ClpA
MGPFDRFNDRAKRVLALAQDEAIRFNHNYIGVEHILLGLVREGEGVAARVLDSLGVELSRARTAVEFIVGRGDATTSPSEITLSPLTKRAIEFAIDDARKLGHSDVRTEHLLLGIVREGEGSASGVLQSLGVSLDQIREKVIAALAQPPDGGGVAARTGPESADLVTADQYSTPHDRLDASSKRAVARAYWEAGRANEAEIVPHHLLLALVANDEAWMQRVLEQVGVNSADLVTRIDAAAPPRTGPRPVAVAQGLAFTQMIARAASLAAAHNCALIRNEHLLIAIAASRGVGSTVLTAVGATQERLREIIDRMNG